jgi:two-component sensor histidine kinase
MVVHELATNAVKYGALSVKGGRVEVRWTVLSGNRPELRLEWCESRGPTVTPPAAQGFGSVLVQREIERELGGTISRDFRKDGMRATVVIPGSPLWST